jgi:Bacterial Ig-like domain (group 2)
MRLGARRGIWWVGTLAILGGLVGLAVGCGSDLVAPKPAPDPSRLYWALTLDHRAVTLSTAAPYDTIQLTATPRSALGTALPESASVVFASTNPVYVQVSPTGLVRALSSGDGTVVTATVTAGGVTHADTAVINVTASAPPPVLGRFSIHPIPPDSAKRGATLFPYPWPVDAADTNGNPIPDLATACTSSDPTVVRVLPQCGLIFAERPGHAVIIASATAYGVTKADTLDFTVGEWLIAAVFISQGAGSLPDATIATGGNVFWINQTTQPIDITFDDSTHVPGGNIVGLDPGSFDLRAFPVPGRFTYHSAAAQASGAIVVVDE